MTLDDQPASTNGSSFRQLRAITLLVTNLIKVGGLAVALNEAFNRPQPRTVDIAVAAFMMAGAQISEQTLIAIAQRMFGAHPEHAEGPKP